LKIEDNFFEKAAFPLLLVSTAILAGSKRFIQYYPGSSFNGLLLQSGLGSGAFLLSDYFLEDKSEIHTILALGISTLIMPALYHQFPTLPKGSTKFGVHQFGAGAVGAIAYQWLSKTSKPPLPPLPKVSPISSSCRVIVNVMQPLLIESLQLKKTLLAFPRMLTLACIPSTMTYCLK